MKYHIETLNNTQNISLTAAADLVSKGFCRENNKLNYADTKSHLETADQIQIAYDSEKLIAFAAYQRQLWPACC